MSETLNPPAQAGLMRVERVSKRFPQRDGPDTVALEDCSFTVEPGKLTVLMGPSGCGKSTLAYLIAGYLELEGEILTRVERR